MPDAAGLLARARIDPVGDAALLLTLGDEVRLPPVRMAEARSDADVPAREFAVLEALLARPGAILSRAQLEDRLYGWGEELESNAISVYVHQLRRKLGDAGKRITTVWGVGYRLEDGA